jgi:hypothetical protein
MALPEKERRPMIENTQDVKPSKKKVYFIRVDEDQYKKIVELAKEEDRSANKMANLLIRAALEKRN